MTSWRNLRRSSRFPENGVGGRNFFLVSGETGSFVDVPAIGVIIGCSGSGSVSVSSDSVSVSVKRDSSSLNSGEP